MQRVDRPQGEWDGRRSEGGEGLGEPRCLPEGEAEGDQRPRRVAQVLGEFLDVEAGERREQGQDQDRREDER